MGAQALLLAGSDLPRGVDFDGSNDFMSRAALTGLSDGKQGTFSAWLRLDGGDGSQQSIFYLGSKFGVFKDTANKFVVFGDDSGSSAALSILTANAYTAGATWINLLSSWDLATPGARHLYVTDVSDLVEDVFVDADVDYGAAAVGAISGAGTSKANMCMAEVFFHNAYLDISVEANRRKFITAGGKPANLGADGSTPLGAQPMVYLSLRNLSATAFATNRGTGGDYTITGTLDLASSSPY